MTEASIGAILINKLSLLYSKPVLFKPIIYLNNTNCIVSIWRRKKEYDIISLAGINFSLDPCKIHVNKWQKLNDIKASVYI